MDGIGQPGTSGGHGTGEVDGIVDQHVGPPFVDDAQQVGHLRLGRHPREHPGAEAPGIGVSPGVPLRLGRGAFEYLPEVLTGRPATEAGRVHPAAEAGRGGERHLVTGLFGSAR